MRNDIKNGALTENQWNDRVKGHQPIVKFCARMSAKEQVTHQNDGWKVVTHFPPREKRVAGNWTLNPYP